MEDLDTILIVAANPSHQQRLRLDVEVRDIRAGLRQSRKRFRIDQIWAPRAEDLRRSLLDDGPKYLHFCGHGGGEEGIFLEERPASSEALAGLFSLFSDSIRCVVLNACYSVTQAEAISRHIDFVVGMDGAIGDTTAIQFAVAFYDALGAGKDVDFAFSLGCNAILFEDPRHGSLPVLFHRGGRIHGVSAARVPRSSPAAARRRFDWDGAPASSLLFGRENAASLVKKWVIEEDCRLVLITGIGGIGKTEFVTCLARGATGDESLGSPVLSTGLQSYFERIVWRSLLNAPAPGEILSDILASVSSHQYGGGSTVEAQIDGLVESLQESRCLVILDNIETILEPADSAIGYKVGYDAYGRLLERVGKADHKSCVLLTSREKPRTVAALEGARRPVRSLVLDGLGPADARDLFAQIATFSGSEDDWTRIVRIYNGNPLALELAARHVDQIFGGSISAFLATGRTNIGDLQDLLDWHLSRLSPQELEIMYWLAIEREPVDLAILIENLTNASSRDNLTSTLQTLLRRIPLERSEGFRWSIQPVLIEHLTERLVECVTAELIIEQTSQISIASEPRREAYRLSAPVSETFALAKATAKAHVRETQRRLILDPILDRLNRNFGRDRVPELLKKSLAISGASRRDPNGYRTGNMINLLGRGAHDLQGFDFSRSTIGQASLDDILLQNTNFSFCCFKNCNLRYAFGNVYSVAFSPDGESIAVGDDNAQIHMVDIAARNLRQSLVGHGDIVSALAFAKDGQTLASCSYDQTVRLWSLSDGYCRRVLLGHQGWVYSIAYSPDGRTLLSASEDGTAKLWCTSSGECLHTFEGEGGLVATVAYSSRGDIFVIAGGSGKVRLYSFPDRELRGTLRGHAARVRSCAISPDGAVLATGSEDATIKLWSLPSGEYIQTLTGHTAAIIDLSFTVDGNRLVSSSNDRKVKVWDMDAKECVGSVSPSTGRVWSVRCSPRQSLFAVGCEDGLVEVYDVDTLSCGISLRGYGNKVWALSSTLSGGALVSGSEDHVVRIWSCSSLSVLRELRGHTSRIWAVATSGDGRWIASASDDLTVRIWCASTGRQVHVLVGHRDWIRTLQFSPTSRLLASGGEDEMIIVWDAERGERVASFDGRASRLFSLLFISPDGETLAAAGANGNVGIFTLDGVCVNLLKGHQGAVNALCGGGDDGALLYSADEHGQVRAWDLAKGGVCVMAQDTGDHVTAASTLGSSSLLITGGASGYLSVWDRSLERRLHHGKAGDGPVTSVTSEHDGSWVASAGEESVIRLWTLGPDAMLSPAGELRLARPYEGMNITGSTGLSHVQRKALLALGAIEFPEVN